MQLLQQPFAWDSLKRCLRSREIRIESLGQSLSLVSTVSLEPEPIPLDIKIVLVGDRMLYYLLHDLDPEFSKFFKVAVDFSDQMDRTTKNIGLYARLIATLIQKKELLAFDRSAVARVVEESSRMVEDAEKLCMEIRCIADLLQESHHWAKNKGSRLVRASHVEPGHSPSAASSGTCSRSLARGTLRGSFHIATTGTCVGQINGLSVIQLGACFGHPVASQPKCAWEEVKWWILSEVDLEALAFQGDDDSFRLSHGAICSRSASL